MNLTQDSILNTVLQIRQDSEVFTTSTATLNRLQGTDYIDGEPRPIYGADISFKCRLITRSGSESHNVAAQAREVQQSTFTELYRMQVTYDLDISEGDHIKHADAKTGILKTFEVLYAPQRHNMMGARVIQLQEVK